MQLTEIESLFYSEFDCLKDRFQTFVFSVEEAKKSNDDFVWHPGVYVWFHPTDGVLRVGRSLDNSRKRSLEHIGANTGGLIGKYVEDPETRILLFNVRDPKDYHWVAALEIFYENTLNPTIRAGRQG